MGRPKKERSPKYNKSDREKKSYSLASLVPEITGVAKDDPGFRAAYQEVKRIVKLQKEMLGIQNTLRIPQEKRNGFVMAVKRLYHGGQERDLYEKMKQIEIQNGNDPTGQFSMNDLERLIEMYKASVNADPDTEEKERLLEHVEIEYEFGDRIDNIRKQMLADIDLVDTIQNPQRKITYMRQYEELLQQKLAEWRQEVRFAIREEKVVQKMVHSLEEYGIDLVTSPIEIPDTIVQQTLLEIVKEDVEKIAKRIMEKNGLQS